MFLSTSSGEHKLSKNEKRRTVGVPKTKLEGNRKWKNWLDHCLDLSLERSYCWRRGRSWSRRCSQHRPMFYFSLELALEECGNLREPNLTHLDRGWKGLA